MCSDLEKLYSFCDVIEPVFDVIKLCHIQNPDANFLTIRDKSKICTSFHDLTVTNGNSAARVLFRKGIISKEWERIHLQSEKWQKWLESNTRLAGIRQTSSQYFYFLWNVASNHLFKKYYADIVRLDNIKDLKKEIHTHLRNEYVVSLILRGERK